MKSLNIDNIALNILPKSYDSHVGINYTSCTSNFNYSYFYNRGISFFNFDSSTFNNSAGIESEIER